jgi:hypothetical protein
MNALRVLFILLALATFACGAFSHKHTMPGAHVGEAPAAVAAARLRVGTVRIDLTPGPGPSTFGHGPDALATHGYWTRLYCRAFTFAPQGQKPFAIVPCDLPAMSMLLQRRVAAKMGDALPASRLMMMATHTHAGPAHYFENEAYGSVLSTHLPGYDDAMVEFMAERIAVGLKQALGDNALRPATLRWSHGAA